MSRGARTRPSTLVGAWVGNGLVTNLGDFESIATYSSINGLNTVTFSNIPQTFKHLQIRTSTIATTDGFISSRFNADSGSNYAWHVLSGDGASATSAAFATQASIRVTGYGAQMDSTNPYVSITDILDYRDPNKHTTIRTLQGKDSNGAGSAMLFSGVWLNSAAVTSIELFLNSTKTYATGSHIALYGIRG